MVAVSSSELARMMSSGAVFLGGASAEGAKVPSLPIVLGSMDGALPDAGLPRGAVVEVASPRGLCRSTTVLLSACASAQAEARMRAASGSSSSGSSASSSSTAGAWCAWLDPSGTLSAGGAAGHGVDLSRLLLVRPPWSCLAKVAVRVVESHIFSVVVIDTVVTPGLDVMPVRLERWSKVVRRLALAVEGSDTTVLLLTDRLAHRSMPLPVAMRIELVRHRQQRLTTASFRVAKDRYGRIGGSVPLFQDAVAFAG